MRETVGLPAVDPDDVALAEVDLQALRHAAEAVDQGIAGDAVLEYSLRVHLLQQVTGDFVETHLQREGTLGQGRPLSVGFADLVGFTRFSEESRPDEIGLPSERLTATALTSPAIGFASSRAPATSSDDR